METFVSRKPFSARAITAFPHACRAIADEAVRELAPFVDDILRKRMICLAVRGERVYVPARIHVLDNLGSSDGLSLAAQCLLTRSTDGYVRQRALRAILGSPAVWVIPFVVLLAGEYVVEIARDIQSAVPTFDRNAYAMFVLENRPAMRTLREKASRYRNERDRESYPQRMSYPGLAVLYEFEAWAS